MSYGWNGLLDSALPNVYINRITLEQKNLQPLSNNPYDITPHIEAPSLTPDKSSLFARQLSVVFDTFLEFPNLSNDDFFNLESLKDHIAIKVLLFGPAGKDKYEQLAGVGKWVGSDHVRIQYLTDNDKLSNLLNNLTNGHDYKYESFPLTNVGDIFTEVKDGHADATFEYVKSKYSKILPDGTTVYKIPVRLKVELQKAFPESLFALVFCALDVEGLDLESYGPTPTAAESTGLVGRIASEVIIQNNKIQDQGMMFFISGDQSVPETAAAADQISKARNTAFNDIKGQLWFGGVHKPANTTAYGKYVAGNTHTPEEMQPFLDYIIVPNTRIQDFRMMNVMQKQLMSFNPVTEMVFGGNYTDFRSNIAATTLDKPAIFSNLMSSVNQKGFVKLFFSIDMGKLIRKHCAIPSLLDKAANYAPINYLNSILKPGGKSIKPLSLKIFRERIDVPNAVINEKSDRKLIYDKYPQYYFFEETGGIYKHQKPPEYPVLSSLVPVKLDPKTIFNGIGAKHYSLTDYSIDKSEGGKYRYSIEIEIHDPTVPFLVAQYALAQEALQVIKEYMDITVGNVRGHPHPSQKEVHTPYYNSYLGEFNKDAFYGSMGGLKTLGDKAAELLNNSNITAAGDALEFLTTATRDNWIKSNAALNLEDKQSSIQGGFGNLFYSMLNLDSATPQSIIAAYEMFDTLTSQLKNTIEAFSLANIPKTDTFVVKNTLGQKINPPYTKMPIGSAIPQRKIIVYHTFDSPSDTVTMEQLDAGYDFFATQKNEYVSNNGLKVINWSSYDQKALSEHSLFFHVIAGGVSGHFETTFQFDGDKELYPVMLPTLPAIGRFFTIPEGGISQYINLPSTIMGPEDDKSFWKLANNIIRYKFSLFGNPDDKTGLNETPHIAKGLAGTDTGVFINATLQRVIKEYQSLNFKGTVFGRSPYRASEISSVKKSGDHPENIAKDFTPPETGNITPTGEPLESDDILNKNWKLPWTTNVGQEDFLLSLIMQNYLNLGFWDIRLRAFDPSISASPIGVYLNNALYDIHPVSWYLNPPLIPLTGIPSATIPQQIRDSIFPSINNLPNQIKVLIINNGVDPEGKGNDTAAGQIKWLHPAKQYAQSTITDTKTTWQKSTLYSSPAEFMPATDTTVERNQMMFLNRFGEFWFRHQNIVEIEYLSGYGTTTLMNGAPVGYNSKYNSSVKVPIWSPLTNSKNDEPDNGLLLCRLKKYRNPTLFNQYVYDILDLPLYDEYFFIKPDNKFEESLQQQAGITLAYRRFVFEEPD